MARLVREDRLHDKTIYFLGLGAIGKLIAHTLTDIPQPPPMTLLFHRKPSRGAFEANGGTIEVIRNGLPDSHGGFNLDYALPMSRVILPKQDKRPPIYNLIVSTKAPHAVAALLSVKHRIRAESTIVLVQNGMGLVEQLNEQVFPDIETRPRYIIGVVSHGALNRSISSVEHTGIGNIAMTALPHYGFEGEDTLAQPVSLLAASTRYLMRTLTRAPLLGCIALSPQDLLQVQFEKLASNCVINPLTAILGCKNGELLLPQPSQMARLLLAEISLVIRSLPELQSVPGLEHRFAPAALERNARDLMKKTAANRSSMLQDLDHRRITEIDYLNGYIFRRGEVLGIRSMVNYTVKSMVATKSWLLRQDQVADIPLADNEAEDILRV